MNSVLAIIVLLSVLLIGYFYYVSRKSGNGKNVDPGTGTDPGAGTDPGDKSCVTNKDCYPNICDGKTKICTIGSGNMMLKIILLQASIADYCETIHTLERLSPKLFENFELALVNIKNFISSNPNYVQELFLPLDITNQKKAFQTNLDKLNALNYCKDFIASTNLNIKSSYTEVEDKLKKISKSITAVDIDSIRSDMGKLLDDMYNYPFKLVGHWVDIKMADWSNIPIFKFFPLAYNNLITANGSMLAISQLLNESHDKFYIIMQNIHDTYTYISENYIE